MCVCFGDPCAKFFFGIEKFFWEIFVLIGSLVELYVGLHLYLCFSLLKKLVLKASLTPPRHLLDTWWIDRESSCLLDSSSTPSGSIELLFLNLILCFSIPQLSTTSSSTPTSTASSIPPDTSAVEHYWRVYIFFHRDSSLISSISLDLSATVHLPNTLLFTPNLFLKDSSSFFKFLLTW